MKNTDKTAIFDDLNEAISMAHYLTAREKRAGGFIQFSFQAKPYLFCEDRFCIEVTAIDAADGHVIERTTVSTTDLDAARAQIRAFGEKA